MADMTLAQLQALVEQQGAELAKLKAAAAATTPAPTEYYTLAKTGEEIDKILAGGGGGGGGVADAVRYGAAQSLTTAQQAQARSNIGAMQGIESEDYPGCYYVLNGSTVEWITPPMELGVEYRTTARYLGKPIYCKLVNFGTLPNETSKRVTISDNIAATVRVDVIDAKGSYLTQYDGFSTVTASPQAVTIITKVDMSKSNAYCWCEYIKTTD